MAGHAPGSKLLDSVFRALSKPRKRGMLNTLLRGMRRVAVHSPVGLYLGQAATYEVNLTRFGNVTDRIVKGLFYHHYKTRLPQTHDVQSFAESGLRDLTSNQRASLAHMISVLRLKPGLTIGEHVFEYWYQATPEDPNTTLWLLRFFDFESFLCFTKPVNVRVPAA